MWCWTAFFHAREYRVPLTQINLFLKNVATSRWHWTARRLILPEYLSKYGGPIYNRSWCTATRPNATNKHVIGMLLLLYVDHGVGVANLQRSARQRAVYLRSIVVSRNEIESQWQEFDSDMFTGAEATFFFRWAHARWLTWGRRGLAQLPVQNSCFLVSWPTYYFMSLLEEYNKMVTQKLISSQFGTGSVDGRLFWPGPRTLQAYTNLKRACRCRLRPWYPRFWSSVIILLFISHSEEGLEALHKAVELSNKLNRSCFITSWTFTVLEVSVLGFLPASRFCFWFDYREDAEKIVDSSQLEEKNTMHIPGI